MTRRLAVLCSAALALVAAGCGEEEPASDGATAEPVATVEVSETEFELDPENATVDESGPIEFVATNDGEVEHSLEVEGPEEAETETIPPGESASVQLELPPGEYKMYCPVGDHEQRGMVGTVTVAGGGGGGGAAGGETEDETETESPDDDSGAGSPSY